MYNKVFDRASRYERTKDRTIKRLALYMIKKTKILNTDLISLKHKKKKITVSVWILPKLEGIRRAWTKGLLNSTYYSLCNTPTLLGLSLVSDIGKKGRKFKLINLSILSTVYSDLSGIKPIKTMKMAPLRIL